MLRTKLMRKRFLGLALSLVSALLLALSVPAQAQQPGKVPRIGVIFNNPGGLVEAFRQGLRNHGYVEGKNIAVEYRYIEGDRDRIPSLVAELLRLDVDILVATSPPTIRSAKQATKTIPIVMVTPQDPVATGAVNSLARPGGNITGLTTLREN
jgi:putative tryptophan/tyrosine transport system substrate-binding protein